MSTFKLNTLYLQITTHSLVTISITEIFALHGCYAAFIVDYLPKFRENLSVPSSGVKHFLLGDRYVVTKVGK